MPGVIAEPQSGAKARKPTKNEQRRAKKKQQKQEVSVAPPQPDVAEKPEESAQAAAPTTDAADDETTIIEIDDDLPKDDALLSQYAGVLARFQQTDEDAKENEPEAKPEVYYDDDDNVQSEDEEEATRKRLSKKQRKAANKLSIAELKAIVRKPEIVEWTDTDAADPKLLVNLKSARNVIPVPNHWSLKREYLSSKRGIEKPGFVLPKFIAETGIQDMRDAAHAKEAEATLKQKQRERVSGKTGKLDIDYQKLYEAFFRRQTKPMMTKYGEVYYEGKEFETNLRHLRPGQLSEELMEALNMGPGAPPPWLVAQQKVGPPPSYPALKIPGLNAPPPVGSSWGYAPGQWGKPPLDAEGRPEWGGDVFGLTEYQEDAAKDEAAKVEPVDKSLWGELQPPEDDEEEEEEEEEEDEDEEEDDSGRRTGIDGHYSGTDTPGGFQSTVPTDFMGMRGMSDDMNLRKQRVGTETEASDHPRSAGQVLNERSIRAEGFFGGERAYDLNGGRPVLGSERDDRGKKRKVGDLDVSMDPDALARDDKMSKEELKRRFEAESAQQNRGGWKGAEAEDLSGLVAEETAKRQKRDREREQKSGRGGGRR